jgi:hypothetical protein
MATDTFDALQIVKCHELTQSGLAAAPSENQSHQTNLDPLSTPPPVHVRSTWNHELGTTNTTFMVMQQQPYLSHLSTAPLQEVVILDHFHTSAGECALEIFKGIDKDGNRF